MIVDILIQIVLIVAIIAIVLLTLVLWKTNVILDDFKETSTIAKKRVKQLDKSLDTLESTVDNASSIIKGFVASLATGQKIKDKFKNFWK